MTTAQVVETSVTVNNNSPIQDYIHPDDQTQPTFKMTPGFKPFTIIIKKITINFINIFQTSCHLQVKNSNVKTYKAQKSYYYHHYHHRHIIYVMISWLLQLIRQDTIYNSFRLKEKKKKKKNT